MTNNRIVSGSTGISFLGSNAVACRIAGNKATGLTGSNPWDIRVAAQDVDIVDNEFANDGSGTSFEWELAAPSGGAVSVKGRRNFKASYASATSIGSLTNAAINRRFDIRATNGNCTIQHGTVKLKGDANVTLAAGNVISLVLTPDGVVREVSRNF